VKLTARHLFRGHGRHRVGRLPGQLFHTRLVHCTQCGGLAAATVHGSLLRCTDGHQIGGQA
jgi:hypothetical protein